MPPPKKATASEAGIRARRFGETLRKELSSLIAFEVKDPKAANGVITRVEVSNDLATVQIHVRLLDPNAPEPARQALVVGLRRASGMMRREVTERLGLRHAPQLRFLYDDGPEHSSRVEELLMEIEAERRSR